MTAALVSHLLFRQIAAMQTALQSDFVSVADYPAAQEASDMRHECLLVGQAKREATVFRRVNGWRPETDVGLDASLAQNSLPFALPLAVVYEGL